VLFITALVSLLLLGCSPVYSDSSSKDYDKYFEKFGQIYLERYDWKWLKAQGLQESLLDPKAKSSAGAQGIMQIMPRTWREETEQLGIIASPYNERVNIQVGARYMRKMIRFWKAPRTEQHRLELAHASYNAGAGNILKSQQRCGGMMWSEISPCLHQVTGSKNSNETILYVKRIRQWYIGFYNKSYRLNIKSPRIP
jgi:soluble lytic murein transglycosylase-like protein